MYGYVCICRNISGRILRWWLLLKNTIGFAQETDQFLTNPFWFQFSMHVPFSELNKIHLLINLGIFDYQPDCRLQPPLYNLGVCIRAPDKPLPCWSGSPSGQEEESDSSSCKATSFLTHIWHPEHMGPFLSKHRIPVTQALRED